MVRRRLGTALIAGTLLAGLLPGGAAAEPRAGGLIDRDEKLAGYVDPGWYRDNVPFVDLPDATVEDTYYYRWRTFKEALKYTGPDDGWIVSEFLGPVGYSAPGGGISAAAGHHVYEGRWLRDTRYLDDYLDYWLSGSGAGPKPATEELNPNTTDWAHQYSFWIADAVVARASVDGRWDRAAAELPALEEQWHGWDPQFDADLGLYWQTPVWDAMEYTASSYQSDDPYHGGEGFRPTLNAYQYGDAKAIASLLRRTGDDAGAADYERRADQLKSTVDEKLLDDGFYKHVMRDGNPDRTPISDREQMGFVPWYFGMAGPERAGAWDQLTDPEGFAAAHGPTTVERRSPWYLHEAEEGCCRWSGPSWPYATSQTLTALAKLLDEQPAQRHVDRQDYYELLRGYALTQRKDGEPYVAEAHHPDEDRWLYDSPGHSEDYNHSTYTDLVLSGLLGIRPQQDDTVRIAPLVPGDWDHFAVEDVAYHGHDLSVVWDRDGRHYGTGAGLRVLVDGAEVHRQDDLAPVRLPVAGRAPDLPEQVDDLVNADGEGFPTATATYSGEGDEPGEAIDGQDFHLDRPGTRWTNHGSPNAIDHLQVETAEPIDVSDVRISFYDDGGEVRTPDSYRLQYRRGAEWVDLPTSPPVPGEPARVRPDPPVRTDALRITPERADGGAVGITELQSWRTTT
ncbi:glycosyl hydrolase family 65 protein [Saccharopolyspora sp. NPDC047091]|uniref:MGH1-like glycoside hydrolase domain-containing protein n=1 Tax=Saccharopolyspora sp. NPDC047091 TaxID=3155924 RepID=UPI0033C4152D